MYSESMYVVAFECVFCMQKTAYEMRISDCSSDVCSSDLSNGKPAVIAAIRCDPACHLMSKLAASKCRSVPPSPTTTARRFHGLPAPSSLLWKKSEQIGRASWRERVCQYV